MMRAWILPILLVLCGSALATGSTVSGNPGTAAAVLVAFVLLAAVNSPLIFPRSIGALEAQRRSADDGRPVVFWRPGCTYCLRLRIRLGRSARRALWVDIWRDPAGAAAVRAVNDGNETVPTVVVAGRPHTNPDPAWVRAQLSLPRRREAHRGRKPSSGSDR
ncbi:glutaredoxin domain-containing protein [Streptomyces sp. NBC_01435]|uniref:glutaredoxin domain-containing protein n=1 Tax=Streptomyces sp. NBC_01435 TaxID=2903865 RepID=UPI002E35794E|nr:glutaredoxin domain-containing protein [Streptomyces sp. NBC_01435]